MHCGHATGRRHHRRQGTRAPRDAQRSEGREDRSRRCGPRGQEDRDRREDRDYRPDPAPSLPERGRVDAQAHGRDRAEERRDRYLLPEGDRRPRTALPREAGNLRGTAGAENGHGEGRGGGRGGGGGEALPGVERRTRVRPPRPPEKKKRRTEKALVGGAETQNGVASPPR